MSAPGEVVPTPRPSGTAVLIRSATQPLEVLLLKRADATAVGDWVFDNLFLPLG